MNAPLVGAKYINPSAVRNLVRYDGCFSFVQIVLSISRMAPSFHTSR